MPLSRAERKKKRKNELAAIQGLLNTEEKKIEHRSKGGGPPIMDRRDGF